MATNYPNGVDDFEEPPNPEEVPLSQAGGQPNRTTANPGRNHVEHHRDLGDAVNALQVHAARRTHDHSGSATDPARGVKLAQANTHENADTNSSANAIHHTLGTGAFQAAAGNHTHDYDSGSILNAPFIRCLSTSRPGDPDNPIARTDGLVIYETDTRRMRVWQDFGHGAGLRWNILPTANIPVVRLQAAQQSIASTGTTITWTKTPGQSEDTFGYFSGNTGNTIAVSEPGVYHIDVALQWNVQFVPEWATIVVCVNGQETPVRVSSFQRGGILANIVQGVSPDFSQTMALSGKIRVQSGQNVTVVCRHQASNAITQLISLFDPASQVVSRLEMAYVGP